MDLFKILPMLASFTSKEELANAIKAKAEAFLADPTDDNFGHLEFISTLICTKKALENSGGVENLMTDLDHTKTVMEMDEMLRSTPNIKTSDN